MNIPILTTAQQQLEAVFEPIMAMMRDLIERSKASNKPSVRDKDSPSRLPREGEDRSCSRLPRYTIPYMTSTHARCAVSTARTSVPNCVPSVRCAQR